MFTLFNLNVFKVVATERERDTLLSRGYTLYVEKEPAAAPPKKPARTRSGKSK